MKIKAFNIFFVFTAGSKKYPPHIYIYIYIFLVEVYYIDYGNVVGNI